MAFLRLPTRLTLPVRTFFAEMPAGLKRFLRRGFSAAAGLPPDKQRMLLDLSTEVLAERELRDPETIAAELGLSEDDASAVVAAGGVLITGVASTGESAKDFVDAALEAELLDPSVRDAVTRLASLVESERSTFKGVLRRGEVANELLPSLSQFETTVDVRVGFDGDRIDVAVPVLLMHFMSDDDEHHWFQMTAGQAEQLAKHLGQALSRLKQAGTLAGQVLQEE